MLRNGYWKNPKKQIDQCLLQIKDYLPRKTLICTLFLFVCWRTLDVWLDPKIINKGVNQGTLHWVHVQNLCLFLVCKSSFFYEVVVMSFLTIESVLNFLHSICGPRCIYSQKGRMRGNFVEHHSGGLFKINFYPRCTNRPPTSKIITQSNFFSDFLEHRTLFWLVFF